MTMLRNQREIVPDGRTNERKFVQNTEDASVSREAERNLVSWCFKPSQPQRIASVLKEAGGAERSKKQ